MVPASSAQRSGSRNNAELSKRESSWVSEDDFDFLRKVFGDETQLVYIENHILALEKRRLLQTIAQWLGVGGYQDDPHPACSRLAGATPGH